MLLIEKDACDFTTYKYVTASQRERYTLRRESLGFMSSIYDSPWNLAVLVKSLPDWSLTGFFSWRDLSQNIADEEHYFMVVE